MQVGMRDKSSDKGTQGGGYLVTKGGEKTETVVILPFLRQQ